MAAAPLSISRVDRSVVSINSFQLKNDQKSAGLLSKFPSAWPSVSSQQAIRHAATQSRKRMFDDPFDYGDDADLEYGDLYAAGKQDATDPRPSTDSTSEDGWLNFPAGHNPEVASLGLYIRGDIRHAVLLVAGGVYENLLFFPIIQLLRDKYPGVRLDVASTPRGKQTYEINKNVRRAWVYDVEDPFVTPAEYTEFLGKLKVRLPVFGIARLAVILTTCSHELGCKMWLE